MIITAYSNQRKDVHLNYIVTRPTIRQLKLGNLFILYQETKYINQGEKV